MLRRELREYTFKLLFHGNFYEGEIRGEDGCQE